jgi:hypothetical protein
VGWPPRLEEHAKCKAVELTLNSSPSFLLKSPCSLSPFGSRTNCTLSLSLLDHCLITAYSSMVLLSMFCWINIDFPWAKRKGSGDKLLRKWSLMRSEGISTLFRSLSPMSLITDSVAD